jgi:transcriptional regulator with XRE-family HTH domain
MRGRSLVGLNIRRIRVAQQVSQERLAFDAGVDRSYLGGMERGEENPTVDILERIAGTLGVRLGELFLEPGGQEQMRTLPRGRKASSR